MRLPRLALWAPAVLLPLLAPSLSGQPRPVGPLPPSPLPGLAFTNAYFPGATYRPEIPTPASLLGFNVGDRAVDSTQITRCLRAWADAAPEQTLLVEYARSHENKPLHYLVITSPANRRQLERIQSDTAKLGDPRRLPEADARRIIDSLPGIAWLAHTIHGDETEGSDAALAIIYHLLASRDDAVSRLLSDLVIIVDPLMNPDGRDRFVKMLGEHRGTSPNVDDHSLLHTGYWPRGRGNHYLFDLNRDWLWAAHPETQGRMREVARWNPQLFVDVHGMGAQDTHLFSPPREPINPHFPAGSDAWHRRFLVDQAGAFDREKLVYYHGEWNEGWYPGYSDSWAAFRGGVGILYEQARIAEDGVRRPEGRILSYRESVFHHVVGELANLATLQANRRELWEHFHQSRRTAISPNGPYARRTFAILPTPNRGRLQRFTSLMQRHGFELHQLPGALEVAIATNQLGQTLTNVTLPAGTLLIPNRQPLGHLLATVLEFDPRISTAALEDERRELLRTSASRIYDSTAWNVTMMFGLEALTLPIDLPDTASPWQPLPAHSADIDGDSPAAVAFVIDGADDRSVSAAARLMERGLQVRVAEKPFRFGDADFARGSVVVTLLDNRATDANVREVLSAVLSELHLTARAVQSGLGLGDLPDLGGGHFHLLKHPRIAVLGRGETSTTAFGWVWHTLDHRLSIRHSHLAEDGSLDLTRYNVLVLPGGGPRPAALATIKDWVNDGGTLIALGSVPGSLLAESAGFSRVRPLPDVLDKLDTYELAVFREWLAREWKVDDLPGVWGTKVSSEMKYPWPATKGSRPDLEELRRRDAWQRLFMPQGALVATRVDTRHWLTAGCSDLLPVLVGREQVLMAAAGVEAPIRYGHLAPAPAVAPIPEAETKAGETDRKEERKDVQRTGWSALPPNTELHLRMSGLLWPEATHRIANAAWLTREGHGRGQIICFATHPSFRDGTPGMNRVFLNAVVFGPGFGTQAEIRP